MQTVTLGTDGSIDYVETADGVRHALGRHSVLEIVASFVRDRSRARRALDEFNATGKAAVALDVETLMESLRPVRARWAASPLIPAMDRTMDPETNAATLATLNANADTAEALLGKLARTAERIDQIEATRKASSKPGFKAAQARLDVHGLSSKVATLLTDVDMASPMATAELTTLASEVDAMHDLFFPSGT